MLPCFNNTSVPLRTLVLVRRTKNQRRRKRRPSYNANSSSFGVETPYEKNAAAKHKLNHVFLSDSEEQGVAWKIRNLPNSKAIGLVVKGRRWVDCDRTPLTSHPIPYINYLGKYSGCTLYNWNFDRRATIATIVATIYRRMITSIGKHKGLAKGRSHLIFKCAAFYAITKNNWLFDRLRSLMLMGNWRVVESLLMKYVSRTDDNQWFVYNQCLLQTCWLTSRAQGPRDKSEISSRILSSSDRGRRHLSLSKVYDYINATFNKMVYL